MEGGNQGKPGRILLLSSIDVVLWAIAQHKPITRDSIHARWNVDRATCYRWRGPLEEARQRAQNMAIPPGPTYRRPIAPPIEARA